MTPRKVRPLPGSLAEDGAKPPRASTAGEVYRSNVAVVDRIHWVLGEAWYRWRLGRGRSDQEKGAQKREPSRQMRVPRVSQVAHRVAA